MVKEGSGRSRAGPAFDPAKLLFRSLPVFGWALREGRETTDRADRKSV
jgi:hypothetical protein